MEEDIVEEEEEIIEYQGSGTKIVVFPNDIKSETTYLSLKNTLIAEIPTSIGNLIHLTHLNIIKNKNVSSLPETIGNLIHLMSLNLEYNTLSSLPETIGNLVKLESLTLNNNNLSSLPKTIEKLIEVRFLDLGNNKLTYDVVPILTALTLAIKKKSIEKRSSINYNLVGNTIEIPIDHAKMNAKTEEDVVYVSITTHGSVPIDDLNNNKPVLFKLDNTLNSLEVQRACALSSINLFPSDEERQDKFSELIEKKLLNSVTCPTQCSIDDEFVTNCIKIQGDLTCAIDDKGELHTGKAYQHFLTKYNKRYPKSKMFSKSGRAPSGRALRPALGPGPATLSRTASGTASGTLKRTASGPAAFGTAHTRLFPNEIGNKIFSFDGVEYLIKGYKKRDWKVTMYIKTTTNAIEEYDITKYLIQPYMVTLLIAHEMLFSLYDFKLTEENPNYRNYKRELYYFYFETLIHFLHKTLNYKNIKIFDFSCATFIKHSLWNKQNPSFLSPENKTVQEIARKIEPYYGGIRLQKIKPILKKRTNKRTTKKKIYKRTTKKYNKRSYKKRK